MNKRLAMLENVTAAGSADAFAWYALALEYQREARFEDALRTFESLRQKDAGYLPMYLMAGQLLVEQGRSADARPWLEQGLELARSKGDGKAASEIETLLASL